MAMHRQFVLASGALLVCVLILVDLHLAMHRIQDVDEDVHMKLATLDKRLRQMPSTHALIDALLSRNGRGVDANATPAVFPPAIAAESRALGGALEDLKRHHLALFQADLDRLGLATMATGNPSPRTGSFKMVMAASKALEIGHSIGAVPTVAAPAAPGCSGVGGKSRVFNGGAIGLILGLQPASLWCARALTKPSRLGCSTPSGSDGTGCKVAEASGSMWVRAFALGQTGHASNMCAFGASATAAPQW